MPNSSLPRLAVARPALFLRWERIIPWIAGAVALVIYAFTAAPGLTWAHHGADGGDLIAATMTWGVPHPSGYPTYVLLARLFAVLPLGPLARRFNLFSAVMAALASALMGVFMRRVITRDVDDARQPSWWPTCVGAIGALTFALAPAVWSQALIAEVYTLHLALLAGLLVLATASSKLTPSHSLVLGILAGVGLGDHLTLALALPGVAILCWSRLDKRGRVAGAVGMTLGLSVYAYVPLAARGHPPVNWGDATTLSRFWWLVSGHLYHRYALAASWPQVAQRLLAAIGLWRDQFGLLGVAMTFLGIYAWIEGRRWRLLAGMGSIWLLALGYAATYDTADSMLYLLPCYLVGAMWVVTGADWLARVGVAEGGLRPRWVYLLMAALLVAIPASRVVGSYEALDLSDDREAEIWLSETLTTLPEGAVLLTVEDHHTFSLWYAQYAQKRRPDLLIVDADLYVEPWYRTQVWHWAARESNPPDTVAALIDTLSDQGPVYVGTNRLDLAQRYRLTREGPVWRLAP